jgi:hypothetical protein
VVPVQVGIKEADGLVAESFLKGCWAALLPLDGSQALEAQHIVPDKDVI